MFAIIATGDELVQPGKPLTCGKTYNCNAGALAALVTHYGGIPKLLGIAKDNERSLTAKIRKGMNMDAIITSGGVSMGDYDLVRGVISKLGQIIFSRIDIGPGGSMSFGKIAGTEADGCAVPVPVLALAGPPTGCLINFETIVRPALFKMMGINGISHPIIRAVARDSALLKRPMNFISWSRLEKVDGNYQVHRQPVSDSNGQLIYHDP